MTLERGGLDLGDLSSDQPQFREVRLRGSHVMLRPVGVGDYEFLRALELSEEFAIRWRHRGATPGPEAWVQSLWQGTLAQFLVVDLRSSRPLGLVCAYNVNFQHGHAYLAAVNFTKKQRSPLFLLGASLFVEYVFSCWNLRKLYMEVAGFNVDQIKSGIGRSLTLEGRLLDHSYFGGRFWDEFVLAIHRGDWERHGQRIALSELAPIGDER